MTDCRKRIVILSFLMSGALCPVLSWGIVNVGDDIELEGYVRSMTVLKTGASPLNDGEITIQRNTAQVEGKYYFLRDGEAFHRFSTGPVEEASFTFLGRAVYDSIYDFRDSYDVLNDRGKEEYKIREAFIDFTMPPFSLRLGRQQVVWGETDNFRALDIINPLDRSWHGTRESWEDIRIPLWMARGIWDIGKVGSLEETFLEVVVIPDDFQTHKSATRYPRPWAFRGVGLQDVNANTVALGDTLDDLYDLNTTVIDGSPEGGKLRNVQGGFRFKGIWKEIDFSFNYFHGFSQTTGIKRLSAGLDEAGVFQTVVKTVNPRIKVFGATASYSEEKYTKSVIRLEATVTQGIPVSIAPDAPRRADRDGDGYDTVDQSVVMIGMDRPTWIPLLNKTRTFFLSSQFFWRRYLDYNNYFQGGFYEVQPARADGQVVPDRYVRVNNDRVDQDEFVATLSASTTYGRAGLWKPQFVVAYDPRSTGGYTKLQLEYLYSNNLVFRAQQYLYWRFGGSDQGPWGLGSYLAEPGLRRNETVFSVTLQF